MGFFEYSIGNAFRDFFTWLFSKHYYSKSSEYFKRLSVIFSKEISKLSKEKFETRHDKKGMPIEIVFVTMSGTLNLKGKVEAVKTKTINKDN